MTDEHKLDEFIPGPTPADPVRKVIAGLLDAVLTIGIVVAFNYFLSINYLQLLGDIRSSALQILIIFLLYRLVSILIFNGTAGMHIFQLQLLNGYEAPPSRKEKVAAAFFILLQGTDYYEKKTSG